MFIYKYTLLSAPYHFPYFLFLINHFFQTARGLKLREISLDSKEEEHLFRDALYSIKKLYITYLQKPAGSFQPFRKLFYLLFL